MKYIKAAFYTAIFCALAWSFAIISSDFMDDHTSDPRALERAGAILAQRMKGQQ